jgi:hypothetical protein
MDQECSLKVAVLNAHFAVNVRALPFTRAYDNLHRSLSGLSVVGLWGRLAFEAQSYVAHESKCRPLRPLSHAALRAFVAIFRAVRGFFRACAKVFLALGAALTTDGNASLGCLAVRWWMRAASSSILCRASLPFWRSSSRYSGIVFVVMARVWQNYPRPSCPILVTR